MKVAPVLWTYHKRKDGKFPVKIRVTSTENKKTDVSYVGLGFSIERNQWTGTRVKNHTDAKALNDKIITTCAELEKNYIADGSAVTGDKTDFYYWFDLYRSQIKSTCGRSHQRKIDAAYNRLRSYAPTLMVKQLTRAFIESYEASLLKEGLHRNYVSDHLNRIRGVFKKAFDSGVISTNPFYALKTIKTIKNRLTPEQLTTLAKFPGLNKVESLPRDMYVFSYYCGGIRFGDMCRLKESNIRDGRLQYTMNKGIRNSEPSRINIPLHPVAKAIFKKYKHRFPVGVDWARPEDSINNRNSIMNGTLRRVCRMAGIPEVTFHTARHSVADLAVQKKLSPHQMKGVLGHKKLSTTEIYLKEFYSEQTDEAMDKLFN